MKLYIKYVRPQLEFATPSEVTMAAARRQRKGVSEPACFGAAMAPGIFYPEPAPASNKREHNF